MGNFGLLNFAAVDELNYERFITLFFSCLLLKKTLKIMEFSEIIFVECFFKARSIRKGKMRL